VDGNGAHGVTHVGDEVGSLGTAGLRELLEVLAKAGLEANVAGGDQKGILIDGLDKRLHGQGFPILGGNADYAVVRPPQFSQALEGMVVGGKVEVIGDDRASLRMGEGNGRDELEEIDRDRVGKADLAWAGSNEGCQLVPQFQGQVKPALVP
jgi:hypothetical protein